MCRSRPADGHRLDVAVAGAGAAGLMAAIASARLGARTAVFEVNDRPGVKLSLTGGGRCNILPSSEPCREYVTTSSRNSLRRILGSWSVEEAARFFTDEAGQEITAEEETGKLFLGPGGAARLVRSLAGMAEAAGASFHFGQRLRSLAPSDCGWNLHLRPGGRLEAGSVILATGGRSMPSTGSAGSGYRIAAALGHSVHPVYPALVPLNCGIGAFGPLSGIATGATVESSFEGRRVSFTGRLLFTHGGLSGPVVMDASHCHTRAAAVGADPPQLTARWLPVDRATLLERIAGSGGTIGVFLKAALPSRLAAALMEIAGVPASRRSADLDRSSRAALERALLECPLGITGHAGWMKAETTGGGVALEEVLSHTLESRLHGGLYLAGEMLDAFGPVGGYNLYWAWLTGRAAGMAAGSGRT